MVSGSLPQGLSLNTNGQIFGTPVSAQTDSFTIMANDQSGIFATGYFTINPTGSNVLGLSVYNNGALISENGTGLHCI